MIDKWDWRYMKIAQEIATWSKDVDTGVGSVIVNKHNSIVGVGFNGVPRGVKDKPERLKRPDKYLYMAHSECNNLDNCHLNGAAVEGGTMYCTMFPCNNCAIRIIQNKIARLVTPAPIMSRINSHYDISLQMFKEVGLKIDYYNE